MSYKVYSLASAERLLGWVKTDLGSFYSEQPKQMVEEVEGPAVDDEKVREILRELNELAIRLREELGGRWGGEFDAQASVKLHKELNLDHEVAADPGFWRWLTFTDEGSGLTLVDLRYKSPEQPGEANAKLYGLGRVKESMFGYLWLRANAIRENPDQDYELASDIKAVDFWWSHIVRVEFGSVPAFARAFTRFVRDEDLPLGKTNDSSVDPGYRNLAPELTRRNAISAYELMTESEAYEFIQQVWKERDEWLWLSERS